MKPSLTTIVKTLNATPSGVVTLGGCKYTLYDIVGRRKLTLHTYCESPPDTSHQQAMQLYGTELEAAKRIRDQLSTLGGDADPAMRKRAELLADRLERGHKLRPEYRTTYGRIVKPREVMHFLVIGEWSKTILGGAVGTSLYDARWGSVKLSQENVDSLRKKGYNIP